MTLNYNLNSFVLYRALLFQKVFSSKPWTTWVEPFTWQHPHQKKGKFLARFSFCSNQNQNVDLFVHTKICYFLKIPVTPFFFFSPFKTTHPVSHRTNILFFVYTIKYSLSEIFADREAEHRCLRIMLCKQARQPDKVFKASGCTELV